VGPTTRTPSGFFVPPTTAPLHRFPDSAVYGSAVLQCSSDVVCVRVLLTYVCSNYLA
jgi:hypothetical protein